MRRLLEFWNLWGMRWPMWEAVTGENSRLGIREAWRLSAKVQESQAQFERDSMVCRKCGAKAAICLDGMDMCLQCGAVQ